MATVFVHLASSFLEIDDVEERLFVLCSSGVDVFNDVHHFHLARGRTE